MTQEEKLKEAKRLYKTANQDQRYMLEKLFPELAESEDERIRKALVEFVKSRLAGFPQCDKYIAWLEKQGEQKPTWSEDDNKWIESLIQTFKDGYLEGFNQLKSYEVISWLESLKERL